MKTIIILITVVILLSPVTAEPRPRDYAIYQIICPVGGGRTVDLGPLLVHNDNEYFPNWGWFPDIRLYTCVDNGVLFIHPVIINYENK